MRDAIDQHTELFYGSLRLNTLFSFCLSTLNAMMVTGTGGLALVLWTQGKVEVGTVAMALPLAWQIVNVAGWVALQVTSIFENIGGDPGGMMTIGRPIALIDRPDAPSLNVTRGEIAFADVRFGYGRETGVIDGRELTVVAGRKDRVDRPLRRGQVDRGQPAAAFLRSRRRPHPLRRPGHRCGHAGEFCARRSPWSRRTPRCCTARSATTSAMAARRRPTRRSSRRRSSPMRTSSSSSRTEAAAGYPAAG